MRQKKIFLSVIVPTYNNKKDILLTLLDIYRHLERQSYTSEIIAIDDNSNDDTKEMIERYQSIIPNLKLVNNGVKMGYDFVVKQAMLLAGGEWRLVMSPYNKLSVIEFNKVFPYARAGNQIFKTPDGNFRAYSAKAAEAIFSGAKRERDYPVKKIFIKSNSGPKSLFAYLFGL